MSYNFTITIIFIIIDPSYTSTNKHTRCCNCSCLYIPLEKNRIWKTGFAPKLQGFGCTYVHISSRGKNEFHFDGCVGGPDKSETCQLKWIKIFVVLFYQGKSFEHHMVCVTMQTSAERRTLYTNQIIYFFVSFN